MSVTIESTEGLGRKVVLTVASDVIEKEYHTELKKVAKNAKIDGFRKGKVPANMIAQRFGAGVLQDVLGEEMRKAFIKVLVDEKINMAGMPTFSPEAFKFGEDLTFSAEFEVYPEIELQGLENIEIEKPQGEIAEADIDKMLEVLRKQQATFKETTEAAVADSRVTMDFEGKVDGELFEGGAANDFSLVMGQGQMIPGFEDGIVDKKAGETFEVQVTFPENYKEELKGKDAVFTITLKKVEEQILPELNDDFVKKFGSKTTTVADLRAEIKTNMEREFKNAMLFKVRSQVIDGLLKECGEFDVPKEALKEEIQNEKARAVQQFGGNAEMVNSLPDELFTEAASRSLKTGLLLSAVVKTFDVQADKASVDAKIAEIASAYEDPAEVIAHYSQNEKELHAISMRVLEDKAIEAVLAKVKVTEVTQSFDELMAQVR